MDKPEKTPGPWIVEGYVESTWRPLFAGVWTLEYGVHLLRLEHEVYGRTSLTRLRHNRTSEVIPGDAL